MLTYILILLVGIYKFRISLLKKIHISDPVTLPGEGEFNLNSLKETEVTESFMGLKQDARGCQNDEEYVDCTTRNYIESIRQQCGCLPLSI